MPLSITTATPLSGPGYMLAAILGTPIPVNTVAGGVFTDEWDAAWIRIGATSEGSEFGFSSTVEPVRVAEIKTPIAYETTDQSGSWSFSMANYSASRLKMAYNGGVGTLAPVSGTGDTALYNVKPTVIGQEVRIMLGWESQDRTVRRIAYQTLQGGETSTAHRAAPDLALIPVTFNLEVPASGVTFETWFAGASRA